MTDVILNENGMPHHSCRSTYGGLLVGAIAIFASVAVCLPSSGQGIEVSVQQDTAAYHRLLSPQLTIPIDWSWEWLPADANQAAVTLTSPRGGLNYRVEVTDKICQFVTIADFSASFQLLCDDSLTATLTFSNAAGDIAQKSFAYDFVANPGAVTLHNGMPGALAWRRERLDNFTVPFDAAWFGLTTEEMSLRVIDSKSDKVCAVVSAPAGRFAFAPKTLEAGTYHLEMMAGSSVVASADVELMAAGLLVIFR